MHDGHFDLAAAATAAMAEAGFPAGFSPEARAQVEQIRASAAPHVNGAKDTRDLLWSSIDNDTSRDLDQIEFAERLPDGGIRISVAIADVAAVVPQGSPIDQHAAEQSQTVYTAVHNFPMLPLELSTDLTSLNEGQVRSAVVVSFMVSAKGETADSKIFEAVVKNDAQLAYSKVGSWLEGHGAANDKLAQQPALQEQLKLQDEAAQRLHASRIAQGALEFHRIESDPVVIDGHVQSIRAVPPNRANALIEELMVAVNEAMARSLTAANRSCIRRVVRSPERWSRIVELVGRHGTTLPGEPDSAALNRFLTAQRVSDPDHYPDLALAIIKLMGPGEYVLARGTDVDQQGHFGLAARDYAHSTAPNRRFADLVTQRVVKALLSGAPAPYTDDELAGVAQHCNQRDSAARKVERAMGKRVAAVGLSGSIGKSFRGVVTGATPKGVYVRVFDPPVEGRIVSGEQRLDVGDVVSVTLVHTDPQRAFIDFRRS